MWTKIKWGLRALLLLFVVAFLHYTLPHRDVMRVVHTDTRLTTIGGNWMFYSIEDSGSGTETTATQRDIRFIEAVYPNSDKVMVYRNEDTGWVWPPYFKWDSSTLQAEAANYVSSAQSPRWVAITHYGWRIPLFSIYPNAVRITPVEGPDVTLIPWLNITIIAVLLFVGFMIRQMWLQFRERALDPAIDRADQAWDRVEAEAGAAKARARGRWGSVSAWLDTWKGKPRK